MSLLFKEFVRVHYGSMDNRVSMHHVRERVREGEGRGRGEREGGEGEKGRGEIEGEGGWQADQPHTCFEWK